MTVGPVVAALLAAALGVGPATPTSSSRTPVVFFPGYGTNRLSVTVTGQTAVPGCPRNGSFEDGFSIQPVSGPFTQVCRDKLLTLRYDRGSTRPMAQRFSRPAGVRVGFVDYGKTSSVPAYTAFFSALEDAGYRADRDLRVADYNFRLTPDMDGFLMRTRNLIERTYRANGSRRVRLVGHSQGPVYAHYLLNHVSRAWKRKYIQGFTAIAGNFPGQGSFYSTVFIGMNLSLWPFPTTEPNARSSARLFASSPSTFMAAADPGFFGNREVVVEDSATGRGYTPRDFPRLLARMGLAWAKPIADHYSGFVRFAGKRYFPGVDTSAEKGSGLLTPVGVVLPRLSPGQVLDVLSFPFILRGGDGNQEDITNDAVGIWSQMPCYRFRLTDNPGVSHDALPGDPAVISRLLSDLALKPSKCSN